MEVDEEKPVSCNIFRTIMNVTKTYNTTNVSNILQYNLGRSKRNKRNKRKNCKTKIFNHDNKGIKKINILDMKIITN